MREERLVLEAVSARVQGMRVGRGLTLGGVEASNRSMLFMSLGDGEGMQLPGLDGDGRRGETGYEGDNPVAPSKCVPICLYPIGLDVPCTIAGYLHAVRFRN